MPEKKTLEKAKDKLRAGKSPSTAAGEFIREEMDRFKRGERGVRSAKQAIAIGLTKARRAGVPLADAPIDAETERTRQSMERAYRAGKKKKKKTAKKKSAKKKKKKKTTKRKPG